MSDAVRKEVEEAKEGRQRQAVTQGVTAFCPGCREDRPVELFFGADAELSYDAPPPLCEDCREAGIVIAEPEAMKSLNQLHRRVLKALMMGKNFADAARLAGCSQTHVKQLVKGFGNVNQDFRRAFQLMLEVEGLDFYSLVKMAKLLLYAQEAKWNPQKERFDYFPDNKTRLGTLRHLTKIRDLDPVTVNNLPAPAAQVVILTNVSGDAEPKDAPGVFTIDTSKPAKRLPESAGEDE